MPLTDDPAPRHVAHMSTNALLLGWCSWLIGSWLIALATESIKRASSILMPFAALIGLTLLWPLLRLSQRPSDHPADRRAIAFLLREWLALNLVLQAVLWPLMVNARWSWKQTFWIDAAIASWSLLSALLIACGSRQPTGLARTIVMVVCLALILGEPMLMGLIAALTDQDGTFAWQMRISPLQVFWDLTRPHVTDTAAKPGPQIFMIAAAACAGWIAFALLTRRELTTLQSGIAL